MEQLPYSTLVPGEVALYANGKVDAEAECKVVRCMRSERESRQLYFN